MALPTIDGYDYDGYDSDYYWNESFMGENGYSRIGINAICEQESPMQIFAHFLSTWMALHSVDRPLFCDSE